MSVGNFDSCLNLVLEKEGGWSNNPSDPGGATMQGVTQAVYSAWLRGNGDAMTSVRNITPTQLRNIYQAQYWDRIQGNSLPKGLDNCIFDEAVNSGVAQSVKDLQLVLKKNNAYSGKIDGVIGLLTIEGVSRVRAEVLINQVCSLRLNWLHALKTWRIFGKGWFARVTKVQSESLAMI